MSGKYSPTVSWSYKIDQRWHEKLRGSHPLYDPEGYDSYGYNAEGKDRAGYTEEDYRADDSLYFEVEYDWAVINLAAPITTSYNSIAKWAVEAQTLLEQGNLAGVKTNLTMIIQQANEEIGKQKRKV